MYHFPNQQLYHHNPYQQFPINVQDATLQSLNTISESQYHPILPQNIVTNAQLQDESTIKQLPQVTQPNPDDIESVKKKKSAPKKPKVQTAEGDESKKPTKKPAVDTSNFSIEERLVAAVWVHERKYSSRTISEIKHNFRRRFGRDPPSKTTLFAWERKLFSTGNVCDAPRTGRPVNRKSHISEVAASVHSAPTLSLRARARALRLPRSTLHNILRNDLPHTTYLKPDKEQATDKQTPKRRVKQSPRRNQPMGEQLPAPAPAPAAPPPPPPAPAAPPLTHMHYVMHAQAHSHGYLNT